MGLDNPLHIAFLLVILLLVFGAKRLPEMGRSLGEGLRSFKDSVSGEHDSHQTVHQTVAERPGDGAGGSQAPPAELDAAEAEAAPERRADPAHADGARR
ncbi:MAG: twin-arginine translocase TatA/TatE family subunit [Solirubrobacteraceae bacterium]